MTEKPKIQSTERILGKFKNLSVPEPEVQESLNRVRIPLAEISPEKSGEIETTFEGKKLVIAYRDIDANAKMKIDEACIRLGIGSELENYDNWREVLNFTLEQEGGVLDFLKLAPAGYQLFFNPDPSVEHGFVAGDPKHVSVCVIGNIATLRAVVTVLHEVGHLWDYARLAASGLDRLTDDHLHTVRAEVLRKERAASAFALNKLRQITKNPETLKDSIRLLKFDALKSYYDTAEERIQHDEDMGRELARDIDQGTLDMEEQERQFYDDFLRWQTTPMYTMWKDNRAPMESYEEYAQWREWLAESGYDYYKDFPNTDEK